MVQIIRAAGVLLRAGRCKCRRGGVLAVSAHLRGAGACRGRLAVSLPLSSPLALLGRAAGIAGALVLGAGQVQAMRGVLSFNMHKLSPKKAAL